MNCWSFLGKKIVGRGTRSGNGLYQVEGAVLGIFDSSHHAIAHGRCFIRKAYGPNAYTTVKTNGDSSATRAELRDPD